MRENNSCPRFAEIGRVPSWEEVPAMRLHLDRCLYCQSQWAATKRVIEVARQLPIQAPDAGRRQQTRVALLIATGELGVRRFSPRWAQAAVYVAMVFGAAGALAAMGTMALPWLHKQRGPTPVAADREFGRSSPRATLAVEETTRPSTANETTPLPLVLPMSPSGATSFETHAAGTSSHVRTRNHRPAAHGSRGALASLSFATPPANNPHLPSPAEQAFSEGFQALRSFDYPLAAASMRRARETAPASPLAEDARYWEAVALARQGSAAKARQAMEDFVRLLPGSPRVGEVSAMLGWLLVESHEWSAAERCFAAARNDRATAVRESAKKGLALTARMQR